MRYAANPMPLTTAMRMLALGYQSLSARSRQSILTISLNYILSGRARAPTMSQPERAGCRERKS